uniref:Uncharacterized protein n=1 Tax=Solanum lycopersicum TaxID=4081 RepID=A0A3Q7JM37_SOLLC
MSLCYWILLFLYFGKLCFDVSYKNVATGTSDASVGTSNVATETSVATAGNAATLDFTYVDAVIGSQSSPRVVPRAGLSSGCTPSASCTPCAGPRAGPKEIPRAGPRAGQSAGPSARCTPSAGSSPIRNQDQNRQRQLVMVSYLDQVAEKLRGLGNIDRVLHSATLTSSTPTNINLDYKSNGPRWKGRVTIIQRRL